MKSIPRKVEDLGFQRFGGTHLKFSGCTWYKIEFWKEKGNLEELSKKANLVSEILARPGFEEQPPEETSRQAGCTRKVAWNLPRKYASSKPKVTTFYSLVKAPETQKNVCLLWIREASMHNAEQRRFQLRSNGHLMKVPNP